MQARLACGSMVCFSFLQKKFHNAKFFVKKNGIFHPAGGDISFQGSVRVRRLI
jgi:hypothetical protein